MPESVVLDKIHSTSDKFDTSVDALVALKLAGATEAELKAILAQGAASVDPQPAGVPAAGPGALLRPVVLGIEVEPVPYLLLPEGGAKRQNHQGRESRVSAS